MSISRFLLQVGSFVLISLLAWGQTRGGGHSGSASRPTNTASTNPANASPPMPGMVPVITADSEGKIEFRTQTILVQVPVVVTDKSGNHVHGLSKEDFHVFENGKEQRISNFEEVISTNERFPPAPVKPGEFSNLVLSEQQPRTVTVIALDTVNTPFLDQTYGRRELVKYLASSLDTGQVLALMIISSHGLKIVQELTGDPTQLLEVLKKNSGELPAMQSVNLDAQADANAGLGSTFPSVSAGSDPTTAMDDFLQQGDSIYASFQQANAIETTMNAFLGISWELSGVPGRKSLIWATGGFPFSITSPAAVPGGYLSALYERAMQSLTNAQISVYPVDVRGLVSTSPISDATKHRLSTGTALARQIGNRSWLQQSSIDTLNEFAEMTGGKAFYNTNDLASSFKRAADDASSYYVASYYLDTTNDRAGWRQLKVKIDKKDTEIRARKGFFVTNATLHFEVTRNSELSYALSSPLEGTGVPLSMKWLSTSGSGDKKKADFLIHLPANGVAIEAREGKNHFNFEVAAAAFADGSKNGQPADTNIKTVAAAVPDAQMSPLRAKGLTMQDSLELGPGKYTVRVVIRDNVTGKVGSVTAPLTVN